MGFFGFILRKQHEAKKADSRQPVSNKQLTLAHNLFAPTEPRTPPSRLTRSSTARVPMQVENGHQVYLERSSVAEEVALRQSQAKAVASLLVTVPTSGVANQAYIPQQLEGAFFVGHLMTDCDSIAGALGAAALYGGTPARASEVNSETAFALKRWGVTAPEPIESLLAQQPEAAVCLVDHQQSSQLNKAIAMDRIVGIIDHHALQSQTIVTEKPIYIDIRPWGSMSTIVAHQFLQLRIKPDVPLAGMLLCAILSDTLNLLGPTTTEWDRTMVALLAEICSVDDIALLAKEQFKAKSKELATMSSTQLVNGDLKEFCVEVKEGDTTEVRIGFAVVETTDDQVILDRTEELLEEIREVREEKALDVLFLAVVNIVALNSKLLVESDAERTLAASAFGNKMLGLQLMDLGGKVSRKKEFVPPLTKSVTSGVWAPASASGEGLGPPAQTVCFVDPLDPHSRIQRRKSIAEPVEVSSPTLNAVSKEPVEVSAPTSNAVSNATTLGNMSDGAAEEAMCV